MILFQNNKSTFVQCLFAFFQENDCIFVSKLGKYPLDPNTIIFLLKLKFLKPFRIKMTNIFILENLLSFFYIFLALINHINLNIDIFTSLKTWHKSYLDILPIPAPQSMTLPLLKSGFFLK